MNLPIKEEDQIINPPAIFSAGVQVTPDSTTVTAFRFDGAENIMNCQGDNVPGAEAGYAIGCQHIKTNAAPGAHNTYFNVGSATSANFVSVESVTPGDVAIPDGEILVGDNTNKGVAKTLGVNAAMDDDAPVTGTLTQANATQTTNTITKRLYTGAVTGTPQVGATLLQATSGSTGTVSALGSGYLDLSVSSDDFDATHVVTGTNGDLSTFTFTPPMTQVAAFTLSPAAAWLYFATSNTMQALAQIGATVLLVTNTFRQVDTLTIETLNSDGWSSINAGYVGLPTVVTLTAAAQTITASPTYT